MRGSILKVVVGMAVVLGISSQAHALTIDANNLPANCGTPTCLLASGPETSQDDIDDIIEALIGSAEELYKDDVDTGESGSLAGSYETTFSNTATDPEDALIEYVGGPTVGSPSYLLVKDGNNNPAWYLFSLDWNGTDDIELVNFWDGKGAISHVTLYGGTSVPDGGTTLSLLGLALAGLGAVRRYMSA